MSKIMFVMMADIQLKEGAENDFKTLFSESNKVLSPFPGFVSRRFLKSPDGSCRIIVEHENQETFMKMIQSPEHQEFHPKLHSFMSAEPVKKMFTTSVE
ncbi:MAG: antibiotic biosynthesis monooxygenase family protein [Nitrosopumilus sp.]